MKHLLISLFCLLLLTNASCEEKKAPTVKETIHFSSTDGLSITGDYYPVVDKQATLILLFHQAGYSRGEYLEITPKLNALGYRCLAIDQRSGKAINGVVNETHLEAEKKNLPVEYVDAIPDLEATIAYAKNNLNTKKVIIWGSSYSAALAFYLGSKYKEEIKGILSFSPGEYFEIDGHKITSFAKAITCPVFITSAKNEQEYWKDIYDNISSSKYFYLPESPGKHGSKALWAEHKGHEGYWSAVKDFLKKIQ